MKRGLAWFLVFYFLFPSFSFSQVEPFPPIPVEIVPETIQVEYDFPTDRSYPELKLGTNPVCSPGRSVAELQRLLKERNLVPILLGEPILVRMGSKSGKWAIGWIDANTLLLASKKIQDGVETYDVKYVAYCCNPVTGVTIKVTPMREIVMKTPTPTTNLALNPVPTPAPTAVVPTPAQLEKQAKRRRILLLVVGVILGGIIASQNSGGGGHASPPEVVTR